jgi:quinol monooxygenase YgiN
MQQQHICLFAKWQIKDENIQTVLNLLPELAEKSRGEEGNLFYKIHQGIAEPHTVMLYEGYKDEAALEFHRNSDHFKELVLKQIVPLLEKRESVATNEVLGG